MSYTFNCDANHFFDLALMDVLECYSMTKKEHPEYTLDMTLCDSDTNHLIVCEKLAAIRIECIHSMELSKPLCIYIGLSNHVISVFNNGKGIFVLVQSYSEEQEKRFYPTLITINN